MAKEIVKHFRMSADDAKAFGKQAEEKQLSESAYFRLLITQKPEDYPEIRQMMKQLINEVNRVGVNINEIVKSNNSGFYSNVEKQRLIAYMQKLNDTLHEAVVAIGNH